MIGTCSCNLSELIHGVSYHQSVKSCVGLVELGGFFMPEPTQELEALCEKARTAGLQLPQAVTRRRPQRAKNPVTMEITGVLGYLEEQVQEVLRCTGAAVHTGSADQDRSKS